MIDWEEQARKELDGLKMGELLKRCAALKVPLNKLVEATIEKNKQAYYTDGFVEGGERFGERIRKNDEERAMGGKERIGSCLVCTNCHKPMQGIRSYLIRTKCRPCGGEPLVDYTEILKEKRERNA
jgi:hypothetical protein